MINTRFKQCGFPVPRMELQQIRSMAQETIDWATHRFGKFDSTTPVIAVIEYFGTVVNHGYPDYSIVPDDGLPGFAAKFNPDQSLFEFSETVWNQASAGNGADRLHVAHELGHYVLGHSSAAFGRQFQSDIVIPEEDSEHQANVFADEYLMDLREMNNYCDVRNIMARFGVDKSTAERRIYNLVKEKFWGTNTK